MRQSIGPRAVSYHKAGHALAAVRLGFEIAEGGVLPPGAGHDVPQGTLGVVRYVRRPVPPERAREAELHPFILQAGVHAHLTKLIAGHIAQLIAAPYSRSGREDDERQARALVDRAYATPRG